jgi:hypothetical protein
MLHKGTKNKYEAPFSGPQKILKVDTNGTVHLCVGTVIDVIICCIKPYKESSGSIHGGECTIEPMTELMNQKDYLHSKTDWPKPTITNVDC